MEEGFLPAQPIVRLLEESGVEDWDHRVIYQLLEFQHSTIHSLIEQSKELAGHRGQQAPNESDLKLAMELMKAKSRQPKETINVLPSKRPEPLPRIQPSKKVRLPKTGLLLKDLFVDEKEEMPGRAIDVENLKSTAAESLADIKPDYNIKESSKAIEIKLKPIGHSSETFD